MSHDCKARKSAGCFSPLSSLIRWHILAFIQKPEGTSFGAPVRLFDALLEDFPRPRKYGAYPNLRKPSPTHVRKPCCLCLCHTYMHSCSETDYPLFLKRCEVQKVMEARLCPRMRACYMMETRRRVKPHSRTLTLHRGEFVENCTTAVGASDVHAYIYMTAWVSRDTRPSSRSPFALHSLGGNSEQQRGATPLQHSHILYRTT